MDRAYSLLTIKSVDKATRVLTGIASTPATDRQDDIVMPEGAEFKLPIPFLWQHNSDQPIGQVTKARVTKAGIEVEIQLAQTDEPGLLKDLLDYAWQSIKLGLVRGMSIGFKSIERAQIDGTYGYRFLKWLWLELSAVTIPANAEASIQTIKSADEAVMKGALSGGIPRQPVRYLESPVDSGKQTKPTPRKTETMKTYAEQIRDLVNARAEKGARMQEIMKATTTEGRSTETAEGDEFDNLDTEIKQIDADLVRLRRLDALNLETVTPVEGKSTETGTQSRATLPVAVKMAEKAEKGIQFARFVMCLGAAKGDFGVAAKMGAQRFPKDSAVCEALKLAHEMGSSTQFVKATVAAGSTTDATWAAPLLAYNQFAGDFVEFLRPQTILGQLNLKRIPFNVHIRGQSSGGAGYWVGEGKPKPLTKTDFNDAYLGYTKVANIAVLTEELMRFSDPAAEGLVRQTLADALIERMDTDFIDPTKAAVAGVSPASVSNGVTPIASSGTTADDVRADIVALWAVADTANLSASTAVYITNATTARRLASMRNALGQKEFPGVTMLGGDLDGVPLVISNYVPHPSAGGMFFLVFQSEIWLADDGQVTVDSSREASLQMLDNPTNDAVLGTATSMVSMFQTNAIALRAERYINWKKRRAQAVAYLTGVNWGA